MRQLKPFDVELLKQMRQPKRTKGLPKKMLEKYAAEQDKSEHPLVAKYLDELCKEAIRLDEERFNALCLEYEQYVDDAEQEWSKLYWIQKIFKDKKKFINKRV